MRGSLPQVFLIVLLLPVPARTRAQGGDEATPGGPAEAPGSDQEEVHPVEQVVVTGSRAEQRLADAPVATEVITRPDIEQSGAENLAEILEEHPGVQVFRSFRGTGLRIQGLDPEYVLVLVDGERQIGRTDGAIDLTRYNAEDIERIEIVRGASSALYGSDAIGGVVNIVTRRCQEEGPEVEAHAAYGSFNTVDVSGLAGYCNRQWNTRLTAGWHRRDAFDLDPSDVATSGSAFNEFNADNRTEYRPTKRARVIGRLSFTRRDQHGVDANDARAVFDRRNVAETLNVSLAPEFRFDGPSGLRLLAHYSLYRDQFLLDQRGSRALDQYQDTREHLVELNAKYDRLIVERHLLSVGVDSLHQRFESDRIVGGTGDRSRVAPFVQDEWTILDEPLLVVVPGFRLDVDTQFGIHPSPKLALRLDPHETLALRASYGWGYRAPSFKELLLRFENTSVGYVVEGNPNLEPETSQSVNVGAEYRPAAWLWMSLNYFWNDVSNLIFTQTIEEGGARAPRRIGYVNIAEATTQGLEAATRVRLAPGLLLEASYTLTRTRDKAQHRPLEGRARHRGTLSIRYRHRPWGIDAMVRAAVVGPRPFYVDEDGDGEDEAVRAAPYATVDLRLAKSFWERALTIFVGAENLLDAGEADFLQLPPRTFYGGMTARY